MAEQQTIDQLVGLAVAMLGVAPGTDWLNARAKQIDAGATVDDIANEIQSSTGFEARYPAFRSDERFAKDFLEALLGDNVTDAIMMAAQDHVTGRLKAGETRGEVAAFLVEAMTVIAADEESPFYADFGKAATAFHNKVMVAKHYTEEALKASPDDKVLEGVTDDPATVETAINNIDNPQVEQPSMEGVTRTLTGVRENIKGTDFDDTFIAEPALNPVTGASVAPLQSSDILDGGDGVDTLEVYSSGRLSIQTRQVKNIERVVLNADTSINADMSSWEGLESVNVTHFDGDVTIEVDGASVSVKDGRTFNGDATIVGAGGAVDINAGEESVVHVGSGDHTETVMVKGGASVKVDSGATGDKQQSKTVTKVVVDGVEQGAVTGGTMAKPATPNTDDVRTAQVPAPSGVVYVRFNDNDPSDGYVVVSARDLALRPYYLMDQEEDLLKDSSDNPIALGATDRILVTDDEKLAAGYDPGKPVEGMDGTVEATVTVNSDAIETIQLHNTNAVAVVTDNSEKKDDDDKDVPDRAPLAVAVEDFDGVLRLEGGAASDDVTFTVVKASDFDLVASTKMVTIEGDAELTLDIDGSAETITVSGKGGVTMAGLSGMNTLKTIDASGSSGANHFRSQAGDNPADKDELKALTMVKGGSGKDTVTLVTSPKGKLEHIDTGDGDDMVMITGAHRAEEGLKVELGAGDDTFVGDNGGNEKSLIDGGADRDTLKLSATPATYKDGDDTKSIFSNFEVLDVGGGTGTFDVELLGIGTGNVLAMGGTAGAVTLKNMANGMGVTVHGKKGMPTTANITHGFLDGVKSNDGLNVNLRAIGGDTDTKSGMPGTTGEVALTLNVDPEVEEIEVDSSASVGGKGDTKPGEANYHNMLTLAGVGLTAVEEIEVTGGSMLTIVATGGGAIESIDAGGNTGGVTFDGGGRATGKFELIGGDGDDTFTGGGVGDKIEGGGGDDMLDGAVGADELTGGAGGDELTGGADNDRFIIEAVSDSQLSFNAMGMAQGVDTIMDFDIGTNMIVVPESLYDILRKGTFKGAATNTQLDGTGGADVNTSTTGANQTTLKAYLEGDVKNGFFETDTRTAGGGGAFTEHPVTAIGEDTDGDGGVDNTWIFIDIDEDGDLNLAVDLAIKLVGDLPIGGSNFDEAS